MDKRCIRQLDKMPDAYCPLAVQRLKALRHAGRELTEEEESNLPGCPWAVSHQMSNYCFFKFMQNFINDDKSISEMEIAHMLNISIESVKKIEKKALVKMREADPIKEIKDMYGDEQIVSETNLDPEWEIPK